MRQEPKVRQVWRIAGEDGDWVIWGLHGAMVWMHGKHCGRDITIHKSVLGTMIYDEHGNKPTEDNDDVAFYDVVKDGDGPYGVKDKNVGGLVFTTDGVIPLADLLGCRDEDGRTCVGFIHKLDGEHRFYPTPIFPEYDHAQIGKSEEGVRKFCERADFRIPVKAVFKRLGTR